MLEVLQEDDEVMSWCDLDHTPIAVTVVMVVTVVLGTACCTRDCHLFEVKESEQLPLSFSGCIDRQPATS